MLIFFKLQNISNWHLNTVVISQQIYISTNTYSTYKNIQRVLRVNTKTQKRKCDIVS